MELLFKSEIENFKSEVETVISNKYKTELEQLNNTILEKDKKIQQLENQIQNAQARNQSEIEKNVDKPIEIKPYESVQSNKENLVSENTGSLFSNDSEDELSRVQLEKLSMTALKKKAKELKIPRYSTYKINTELINEILKLNK